MARLRMIKYVGGTHGQPPELWPAPGDVVELDDEVLIAELLRSKAAEALPEEKAKPKPAPVVETAEKAPPENTAKRTRKPAPRKGTK